MKTEVEDEKKEQNDKEIWRGSRWSDELSGFSHWIVTVADATDSLFLIREKKSNIDETYETCETKDDT
ncbi:hypothetical protein CDAR_217771 [Caerostris darwini]|uniref:Uncharacterized protein n=1 Tax=Caerostris darwini TaxID=1538125 RepID=A0AAV4MY71_9ARAC|nr:hypothetical protein CDAR_217771 [Caerostris darwini]